MNLQLHPGHVRLRSSKPVTSDVYGSGSPIVWEARQYCLNFTMWENQDKNTVNDRDLPWLRTLIYLYYCIKMILLIVFHYFFPKLRSNTLINVLLGSMLSFEQNKSCKPKSQQLYVCILDQWKHLLSRIKCIIVNVNRWHGSGKLHILNKVNYTLGLNNNSLDALWGPYCRSPLYKLGKSSFVRPSSI